MATGQVTRLEGPTTLKGTGGAVLICPESTTLATTFANTNSSMYVGDAAPGDEWNDFGYKDGAAGPHGLVHEFGISYATSLPTTDLTIAFYVDGPGGDCEGLGGGPAGATQIACIGLVGAPGADILGVEQVWQLYINLESTGLEFYLPDGEIGWSYQTFDTETNPVLVVPSSSDSCDGLLAPPSPSTTDGLNIYGDGTLDSICTTSKPCLGCFYHGGEPFVISSLYMEIREEVEPVWVYWPGTNDPSTIQRASLVGWQEDLGLASSVDSQITLDTWRGKIYWPGNDSQIHSADLDGTGEAIITTVFPVLPSTVLTLDASGGRVYWAGSSAIHSIGVDGTGESFHGGVTDSSTVLALDTSRGKIFWAYYNEIRSINMDLTGVTSFLPTTYSVSTAPVLDTSRGQIFWASDDDNKIHSINMDGTGETTLLAFVDLPTILTLDASGGKLYWADFNAIHRINLDGTGGTTFLLPTGDVLPSNALALDVDHVYWHSPLTDSVHRMSLDGSTLGDEEDLGTSSSASAFLDIDLLLRSASETTRLGTPPNPDAFKPGQTSGPVLGATWDPVIDHTTFLPAAVLDFAAFSAVPSNISLPPLGTLLCALPTVGASAVTAGTPFAFFIPVDCSWVGLGLCCAAGSIDAGGAIKLTNALDITLGGY